MTTIRVDLWRDFERLMCEIQHATDKNGNYVLIEVFRHVACECHEYPRIELTDNVVFECFEMTNEVLRDSMFQPMYKPTCMLSADYSEIEKRIQNDELDRMWNGRV
jgi:hypothetical protein